MEFGRKGGVTLSRSAKYTSLYSVLQERTGVAYCDYSDLADNPSSKQSLRHAQVEATIAILGPILDEVSDGEVSLSRDKTSVELIYTSKKRLFAPSIITIDCAGEDVVVRSGATTSSYDNYPQALMVALKDYWRRFWEECSPSIKDGELTRTGKTRHVVSGVDISKFVNETYVSLSERIFLNYESDGDYLAYGDTPPFYTTKLDIALSHLYYYYSLEELREVLGS